MTKQFNSWEHESEAKKVLERFEKVKGDRSGWVSIWEEAARYVLPRYTGSFNGQTDHVSSDKSPDIYDTTAVKNLPIFAAAMESLLTPHSQKWHKLGTSDPYLMKSVRVRRYFEEMTNLLFRYRYNPKAKYATAKNEEYLSLGAFGTGGMLIEPSKSDRGFEYTSLHLGNLYIDDEDTLYRVLRLTGRQATRHFGFENLPERMQKEVEKEQNPNKKYEFVHFIGPRKDYEPGALDQRGMKYRSLYVSKDFTATVKDAGYRTFPIPISRYVVAPGEKYGRSVAMTAMGAIKTLNEQKKTTLKAGHRAVEPPLLAYDDGVLDTVSLRNGAINHGGLTADGRKLVQPLFDGSNFQIAEHLMNGERKDIDDIFLVSLYNVLTEGPEKTATEIIERVREKGALLSPAMNRQQTESLGPQIEREIDILVHQGLAPEMPGELIEAEGEYEVVYDSPMARAQRAEEASGLIQYMDFAGRWLESTGDSSFFDHVDPDAVAPELQWILSVNASWLRTPEDIAAVREGRANQAQIQQAIEAAPAMAGLAKATGN